MPRHFVVALAGIAFAITIGIDVAMIRSVPELPIGGRPGSVARGDSPAGPDRGMTRGVAAVLAAGEHSVHRTLPSLAFRLEPGASLDPRLPAGPFNGSFTVTFASGRVRNARLGAWISGGSLIIERTGQHLVVDAADDEPVLVMSREPVFLGSRLQQVRYDFTADAGVPSSLRAMWQPEGATTALPMPASGASLIDDAALRGLSLAQQLGCASCHRSADASLQAKLAEAPAPRLEGIGARARPAWIMKWLRDPAAISPGTAMPAFAGGLDGRDIEDLAHFLIGQGGPVPPESDADISGLVATGRLLYHQVGCFTCHGPLEADGDDLPPRGFAEGSARAPLGHPAMKATVDALAGFLADPVATRPSGQMPSLSLEEREARAIAAYLHQRDGGGSAPAPTSFTVDPQAVERGAALFSSAGCAACHALDSATGPIESTLVAPPLESLAGADRQRGCVSGRAEPGVPNYSVTASQREALAAFVGGLDARRADDVPIDDLAVTMARLRCTACHVYEGQGGPSPSIASLFTTVGEADLGDEGRLPPKLGDVGAKLNPAWLRSVLEEDGRARPYLGVRMPEYGERAVGDLGPLLSAAAGVAHAADHGPEFDTAAAEAGRELVGANAMNCIQCHDIAGRDSTGTPGPDLALMAERLRFDAFSRWLHDPAMVRPGTRMPSFFLGGRSAFVGYEGGDVDAQVRAIWCYLSQGELLPLPEGLVDPAGLAIDVVDEPVVFRTFMKQSGVRAIACGFPEQVHCAFDAEACRLSLVWQGPFLNAKGAWAARGGSETDPEEIAWTADEAPLFRSPDASAPLTARFRGYRLDAQRRPLFRYALESPAVTLEVQEQPRPVRRGLETGFSRRFVISGPPGAGILVVEAGQALRPGDGLFAVRESGVTAVTLGDDGRATFELEVSW